MMMKATPVAALVVSEAELLLQRLIVALDPPPGPFSAFSGAATGVAIEYSVVGVLGRALAVVFEPIGLNWQISIALVPGLAAREVAVGALMHCGAYTNHANSATQSRCSMMWR